jgi:flagellar hook assembly protein FlgD
LPFEVSAARPNPFSSITAIEFSLKGGSHHVLLRVLDASGRPLRTLACGTFEAGSHTVYWDGKNAREKSVPEGVYFYQFEACNNRINRKVILAR